MQYLLIIISNCGFVGKDGCHKTSCGFCSIFCGEQTAKWRNCWKCLRLFMITTLPGFYENTEYVSDFNTRDLSCKGTWYWFFRVQYLYRIRAHLPGFKIVWSNYQCSCVCILWPLGTLMWLLGFFYSFPRALVKRRRFWLNKWRC